mmetsp:Transcript_30133/g.77734  ORF Transcript_30133/g.77734 Transcript_30133/m.77734 type:complete len:351 (-) Transcript_30133:1-1053(-)
MQQISQLLLPQLDPQRQKDPTSIQHRQLRLAGHRKSIRQIVELVTSKKGVQGRVLGPEPRSVGSHLLERTLQDTGGIHQSCAGDSGGHRNLGRVTRVGLGLAVHPRLGHIIHPFSHEDLPRRRIEIRPTALAVIHQPTAFVRVAVGLGQGALAVAQIVCPFAQVEIPRLVLHLAMAMALVSVPIALVHLTLAVKTGASAMALVVQPPPSVELPQLVLSSRNPQHPVPRPLAPAPLPLVLPAVSVSLYAVAVLLVVLPVALVALGGLEVVDQGTILCWGIAADPIDGPVGPVFLGLGGRGQPQRLDLSWPLRAPKSAIVEPLGHQIHLESRGGSHDSKWRATKLLSRKTRT